MGFFYEANKPSRAASNAPSKTTIAHFHKMGCQACPLNNADCHSPKMEPSGDGSIYVLVDNPTREADRAGVPWKSHGKRTFLSQAPRHIVEDIRYNSIVRTSAGKQPLTSPMIESCRPSVIKDIERTKPVALIGIGEEVLRWVTGYSNIWKFSGRRMPVKIGKHVCWFYPLHDPDMLAQRRKYENRESEDEFAWRIAVRNAFDHIESEQECPAPLTPEEAREGLEYIDGSNGEEDITALKEFLRYADEQSALGFDYETNDLRPYNDSARLLTCGISGRDRHLGLALAHPGAFWTDRQFERVLNILRRFFMRCKKRKAVHSLAFELEWTGFFFGLDTIRAQRWEDTMTQAWVLDEHQGFSKPDTMSLAFLTLIYFGLDIKTLSGTEVTDLENAPLDFVLEYQALDAKYHRKLYLKQQGRIIKEGLTAQYEHMLERVPTCVLTQLKGIPVSQQQVQRFKRFYEDNLTDIEDEIQATAAAKKFKRLYGKPLSPGNSKEVLKLITKVLGEDATDKKDKESSGFEVLDRIDDPIAKLILEWRMNDKGLSTYVKPVIAGESPHVYSDGLIHPTIMTTKTDTSRTSSGDPNAQNWPKRKKSKIVRRQIRGTKRQRIVSFDYAGIQARNIAMESLDKNFIQSFWTGYDPHAAWSEWLAKHAETDWDQVHKAGSVKAFLKDKKSTVFKDARSIVKNRFVFPTFFGAQPRSISINLGVGEQIIEQMQEELFEEFPSIKLWQDGIREHYAEHGWVTGLSGIRRRAPCSPNQLINAPIQADESFIVMDAFSRISNYACDHDNMDLQPIMEIHDDLTFLWDVDLVDEYAPIVIEHMVSVPFDWAHCVPIEIEMSIGKNWADQKEIGKFRSDTWKKNGYNVEDYD